MKLEKKIVSVFATLGAALALTACVGSPEADDNDDVAVADEATVSTTAEALVAVGPGAKCGASPNSPYATCPAGYSCDPVYGGFGYTGNFCVIPPVTTTAAIGGSCQSTQDHIIVCPAQSFCSYSEGGYSLVCIGQTTVNEGQRCGTANNISPTNVIRCADGLYCTDQTNGVCTHLRQLGESCNSTLLCDYTKAYTCDSATHTCAYHPGTSGG